MGSISLRKLFEVIGEDDVTCGESRGQKRTRDRAQGLLDLEIRETEEAPAERKEEARGSPKWSESNPRGAGHGRLTGGRESEWEDEKATIRFGSEVTGDWQGSFHRGTERGARLDRAEE